MPVQAQLAHVRGEVKKKQARLVNAELRVATLQDAKAAGERRATELVQDKARCKARDLLPPYRPSSFLPSCPPSCPPALLPSCPPLIISVPH